MTKEDNNYVLHGPEPYEMPPENTLGQIIYDALIKYPKNQNAMVDVLTGETITYHNILKESCNLSEALRRFGCNTNTVISISSENNLQFFIPVVASLFTGSIVAPINPIYSDDEFAHTLNIMQPTIIFTSAMVAPRFSKIKENYKCVKKVIVFNGTEEDVEEGEESLNAFLKEQLKGEHVVKTGFKVFNKNAAEQPAFIMSSSGTTGLPKGVMITHRNVAVSLSRSRDPRYTDGSKHNLIGIMPFFHAYGLNVGIGALVHGHYVVVFQRFDEDAYLKAIQDYKVTSLILAPPLAVLLAKTSKLNQFDLSSVRQIGCGAAPLSEKVESILKERFKLPCILQAYGLTETTLAVSAPQLTDFKPGSVGKVATFTLVKFRDPETGKSLGIRQKGEICVKGLQVMKGYYKNEKATRDTFTPDGWLKTGDIGYYDEDGHIFIVDRLKELIKYKGFQVAPAELEAILLTHPEVVDVGVVGLPDEWAGELPLAFVVAREDNLTEKEIQDYVAKKVSPQKKLRGGVIFVDDIPKNPSGKILRKELREMLKEMKNLKSKL